MKYNYFNLVIFCCVVTAGCWDATFLGTELDVSTASENNDTQQTNDTLTDSETTPVADTQSESESGYDSETDSDSESESDTASESDSDSGCGVPTVFQWNSSAPLIYPPADMDSIKDPSPALVDDQWYIFATLSTEDDLLSLGYVTFTNWSEAGSASVIQMNTNPGFSEYEYMAAPQFFYFAPKKTWFLVFQTQEPTYSTTLDPADVNSWSAPTRFLPTGAILGDTGLDGFDYWIICDDSNCYMFFSDLNGGLYRSKTSIDDFPEGFTTTTEPIMRDENRYGLYDACNVYKMGNTGQYLLLVSALGANERFSKAWTADHLEGEWLPLKDSRENAFVSMLNTSGAEWSAFGISHGELLRRNPDETMSIDTCNMHFLYSGLESDVTPGDGGYRLGLLSMER